MRSALRAYPLRSGSGGVLLAGLSVLVPAHGFWRGVLIVVVIVAALVFVASFFAHIEGGKPVSGGEGKRWVWQRVKGDRNVTIAGDSMAPIYTGDIAVGLPQWRISELQIAQPQSTEGGFLTSVDFRLDTPH